MGKRAWMISFSLIIVVLAYGSFFWMNRRLSDDFTQQDAVLPSSVYDIAVNGDLYQDTELGDVVFEPLKKGSVISYNMTLPEGDYSKAVISIYSQHSKLELFRNGEMLYEYDGDGKHMFGYGDLYFMLEGTSSDDVLTVRYEVMEDDEVTSVTVPSVYPDSNDYFRSYTIEMRYGMIADFSIILIGLVLALMALIFMFVSPDMLRLFFLAISIYGMGMWEFSNFGVITVFSNNLALKGYIEYLSFYISPVFFTLYFGDDFHNKEKTKRRYIYRVVVWGQMLFVVLALLLHFTDIIHLPKLLPVCHVLLVASLAYITYMSLRALHNGKHMHKPFLFGLMALVVFITRDMTKFILYHYVGHDSGERYTSFMLLGILIFAISMFVDFFSAHRRRMEAEARSEAYNKMAHTDMMTGLSNRRKCEEVFEQIGVSGEAFILFNFDLNDLKKTNDNYGHECGDALLNDFAKLLKESFPDDAVVGRMGGDEFLAIITDAKHVNTDHILAALKTNQDKMNENRTPLPLSFAYGVCESNDKDLSGKKGAELVSEAYKLSDERMYKCKIEMKKNRSNNSQ